MERFRPAFIGSNAQLLAFAAFLVLLAQPANSQTPYVALLLQQTPAQGGTVSPQAGVHHFELNSMVTLVAIPKPGYQFVYWLGDVVDPTANKTTAYLNKPKIVVAVFQQVDDDQLIVGQNAPTLGGGGGDFGAGGPIMSAAGLRRGGVSPITSDPGQPVERDDPDPPDDPPIDPPDVPEPATGMLLALGALALARRRKA